MPNDMAPLSMLPSTSTLWPSFGEPTAPLSWYCSPFSTTRIQWPPSRSLRRIVPLSFMRKLLLAFGALVARRCYCAGVSEPAAGVASDEPLSAGGVSAEPMTIAVGAFGAGRAGAGRGGGVGRVGAGDGTAAGAAEPAPEPVIPAEPAPE